MTIHQGIDYHLIPLNTTDSTNNYLKKRSKEEELPEFTLVTASHQTAGRGQRSNFWESNPTENLLFSLLIRPIKLPIQEQFMLSEVVSISLVKTLQRYSDDFTIKWPNDIYWQNKKICGILIEHDLMDQQISQSIIGVGLNVNQKSFISNAPNPISLLQITQQQHDINDLLHTFCAYFAHYYERLNARAYDEIRAQYKQLLYRGEGFYYFADSNGLFEAKINTVDKDGLLHLTDRAGKQRSYLFKEVQYII